MIVGNPEDSSLVRLYNKEVDKYKDTKGAYAEIGDTLYFLDGIFFLVQDRQNEWNNIISLRVEKSSNSLKDTITKFVLECKKDNIQYVRVNGREKWKKVFEHFLPEFPEVSIRENKNELILKLY